MPYGPGGQPGPYGRFQQPYPPGGYPYAAAPYGVHPITGEPYSDKSKVTAGLLQLLLPFVGVCGVGRLYAGHIAIGIVQLVGMLMGWVLMIVLIGFLIVPAIWLWTVIDGIVLLVGEPRDGLGRLMRG
jgi:TM2 domain-containing membrane protein YozV